MNIQYAIRVTTDTAIYNESYGMGSTGVGDTGVFTWITGNPGYTGAGAASGGATGEAGLTGVDGRWNEGWLDAETLGNPSREIDISIAGNYGTMAGFSFGLLDSKAGVGSQFRKFVADNDIKFTGRKVEAFCVIDDVFYRMWTGKVANNPVDESHFIFSCDDTCKQVHKQIPPIAISKSNFPNAKNTNGYIPVSLGDIPYAQCLQVEGDAERIPIAQSSDGQEFESVQLYGTSGYIIPPSWTGPGHTASTPNPVWYGFTGRGWQYNLYTYGKAFETNCFGDGTYYLNVTHGTDPLSTRLSSESFIGDFPDTSQLVPILTNSATWPVSGSPLERLSYKTEIITKIPISGHNKAESWTNGTIDWIEPIRITDQVLSAPTMYEIQSGEYFLSIVRLPTEYIVSMGEIHEFKKNDLSHIQLYVYNANNGNWEDVSHNVLNYGTLTADGYQAFKAPHGLSGESLVPCGVDNYSALIPIRIPKIELVYSSFGYAPYNGSILCDGKRNSSIATEFKTGTSTSTSTTAPPRLLGNPTGCLEFDLFITDDLRTELDEAGLAKLYLIPDFKCATADTGTFENSGMLFTIDITPLTVQGYRINIDEGTYQTRVPFPTSSHFPGGNIDWHGADEGAYEVYKMNFIPSKYWRIVGWDCLDATDDYGTWENHFDEHYCGWHFLDIWSEFSFRYCDVWELKCLPQILSDRRIQRLRVRIRAARRGNAQPSQYWRTWWHQFALIGVKSINLSQNGIYTRLAGEEHLNVETNSVYTAFRKILEGYDGIALADIDYGNLSWTRQSWHVGRQLLDQKSSFEYLQQLARQSFVGIVPKRDGRRKLSAWREDTASPLAHNSDSIVRDGLESWEQTPLNTCFNEFALRYNWDPGAKAYTRSVFVGKVDGAWPGETGAWGEYVGSSVVSEDASSESEELSGSGAYPDCKDVWDVCHESWTRTKVLNKDLSADYSELPWYIDYSEYDPDDVLTHQGVDSSAWKYLRQLAQWTTRQKDIVTYRIPLTAANLQNTELLKPVSFSDPIWSANAARTGWVTRVSVDTRLDQIVVTTMLQPDTIYVDSDDMVEEIGDDAGALFGDPIYEETGSADIIEETGVT